MSDPHDEPRRNTHDQRPDGELHPDLDPVEETLIDEPPSADADNVDEDLDDLVERVVALVEADAPPQEIAREVEQEEPADAADLLEALPPEDSAEVLTEMEEEAAAEAMAYMDPALASTILIDLPQLESATLLLKMASDDAVDILQAMPKEHAARVLAQMPARDAALLSKLALFDPDTAGGLMTTDVLMLPAEGTVAEAVDLIRAHPDELEHTQVFVVDRRRRLVGEVDIRSLLINQPGRLLAEFLDPDVDILTPEMPSKEVAEAFQRYDHLALPVVDADRRLLGIVTVDDVIDIIRELQTQEAYKQVGVGAHETVHDPLPKKLRGRFPWLLINLLTSQVAAVVVYVFHDMLDRVTVLAVLMGMIANQAGNAGQQSLAVTLRGLVLGDVHRGKEGTLLGREVALGAVSGLIIGVILALLIGTLAALGVRGFGWHIGFIAGVAMAGSITMGCLVGAGMPLLLHRKGLDPATGSSIFLTMTTDTVSFLTFLGLSFLLRAWLIPAAPTPA